MNFRSAVFGAFSGLVLAGAASATPLTLTYSHVTAAAEPVFTDDFTLPSFDVSRGILTGVTVTFAAAGNAVLQVVNISTQALPFTNGQASVPASASGPDGTTASVTLTSGSLSGVAPGSASPQPTSFPGPTVTTATTTAVVPAADFALYESAGGVPAAFSATFDLGTFTGTGGNNKLFFGGTAFVGGTTSVIYSFVPEPETLALMGAGILGLALTRRRRV